MIGGRCHGLALRGSAAPLTMCYGGRAAIAPNLNEVFQLRNRAGPNRRTLDLPALFSQHVGVCVGTTTSAVRNIRLALLFCDDGVNHAVLEWDSGDFVDRSDNQERLT